MCGLVGAITKMSNGFTKKAEDVFYQLLNADVVRGDDATGVIYVENDTSFGFIKEATSAPYCIDAFKKQQMAVAMLGRGAAMIGHNRKATMGKLSDGNAHPFVADKTFAMVHNGTLYSHKHLADVEVDSEALTIHLSKVLNEGYTKEKLEVALSDVYGAYAVVGYNQLTDTVYFIRNKERPLFYADGFDGVFWASEALMLAWILSRNGIDLKTHEIKELPVDTLMTFHLGTNKLTLEGLSIKKHVVVTQTNTPTMGGKWTGQHKPPQQQKPIATVATSVTKSAFKRLKKKLLGSNIIWFVSDYVEKNFPKTIANGETEVLLMGDNEKFEFEHAITASVDINDLSIRSGDELVETYYTGTICEVDMASNGFITIRLMDASPLPLLTTSKKELVH